MFCHGEKTSICTGFLLFFFFVNFLYLNGPMYRTITCTRFLLVFCTVAFLVVFTLSTGVVRAVAKRALVLVIEYS